ncbi:NADP-dependent 3-hydroxy acid dehydrogenase YdfG [Pedobacter westerhofensis]|uniref:NADP-dependent 3-hydroxy acid dehydrogenase YdfG n=1 Tax=Pedobacter westerhofensis TaxID=425512 RepID=A0A521CZH5_9SPHI|nr:SDR family oxidoreductase [Pedobacter westerhofensis]SMO64812.1 NADP-dependent 3-hydroxy acid dehydrogenase YdfG [Pedobacter westerhofensis]
MEIKGKIVVITGASSGIGEAAARMLAGLGAKVVLGARRPERLESIAAGIVKDGGEAVFAVTDVKRREDLSNLVKLAVEQYGRVDVIINNAGIARLSRIDELDIEAWEEMIDINLKGVLYGIAAVVPEFKKQGYGQVINIISTSGIKIVPLQGVYAGTKNAVRTISEAFRQESKGAYRITGISPGMIRTELTEGITDPAMRSAMQEHVSAVAISADAIASAVVFAIGQPSDVEVGDIVVRPAAQD